MEKLYTCSDLLRCVERSTPNPKTLNNYTADGWKSTSTEKFLESVHYIALGLYAIGMRRGDKVGIYANGSAEWTIADLAIMISGGVCVPLFANISEDNFIYQVKETQMNILFIEGEEQWDLFRRHESLFEKAVAIGVPVKGAKILSFDSLIEKGRELDRSQPKLYQQLRQSLQPTDLASIIYTSGSTGVPKGVELTQHNLTCVLDFNQFNWRPDVDKYLSVLPLAHVFGHCINLWVLAWGACVYYTSDYKNLGAICRDVKPTAIVVVPRLLEKVYLKMVDNLHNATGLKRKLGEWAFGLAKVERPNFLHQLLLPLADKIVFHKLREALGGKIRIVISGGAPLNPQLQRFFDRVGIPIYEGWGLTEACPVCVNTPRAKREGTVGKPLHDQKLMISPQGEVLVKGTLVMRGYFMHPELTATAIDKDGWLHTGDRGSLDKEGFLTISGRIKELYKTSTGEYVAPVPIEQALGRNPLIEMSMVVAEGRKFTSCLLFPNLEMLARMKAQRKVEAMSDEQFLQSDILKSEVDKYIEEVNKHLNHWEQVRAYRFILEPLTIQRGELTPSMKIRREVVAKKYNNLIEEMYSEEKE